MNLFCICCNENHEFPSLQVKQLIYGLQAMLLDEQNEPRERDDEVEFDFPCLKVVYGDASDSEGYLDHTTSCLTQRYADEIEASVVCVDGLSDLLAARAQMRGGEG